MALPPMTARSSPPRASLTVGTSLPSAQGSWERAPLKEVGVSELRKKLGQAEDGWQGKLLKAADEAGPARPERGNGHVSAAELHRYLAEPGDARFLTSTALQRQRAALEQKLTGSARTVKVDAFNSDWQDTVARRADQLSGDGNGRLSRAELDTFFRDVKAGRVEDTRWVPDQQAAMLESKVAEAAGEVDPLRPSGPDSGLGLAKEYMRASVDTARNVPRWVSYELSAADIQETPAEVNRTKSHFQKDAALGKTGPLPSDYDRTGFDRGHMKPAESSPTQEAMDESHLMSNIAPQHPNMNRQAWRTLEDAVHDLVQSTGGKAHIFTGNLFLDAKGKPLPPEALETLGKARRIAVPTHQFKTVLLEKPDGSLSMFAYLAPNPKDAPTKKADIERFLDASRVPVDRIEELLGQDLYAQLPPSVQEKLEAETSARVAFRRES